MRGVRLAGASSFLFLPACMTKAALLMQRTMLREAPGHVYHQPMRLWVQLNVL